MRADGDDMPDYLQPRSHTGGAVRWLIAGLLGVGITAGVLYMAGGAFSGNMRSFASQKDQQAEPAPTTRFIAPEPVRGTDWDQVVEEQARRDAEHQAEMPAKQTSFNDQNYIPRGADNVVPAERTYAETPPEQGRQKPLEVVVIGEEPDYNDQVCTLAHGKGSVEARNCKAKLKLSQRNR